MLEKIIGLFDSAYWWNIAFDVFSGWYATSTQYDEQIALDEARRKQRDTGADFARLRQQSARREQRDSADACSVERNAAVHDALGAVN